MTKSKKQFAQTQDQQQQPQAQAQAQAQQQPRPQAQAQQQQRSQTKTQTKPRPKNQAQQGKQFAPPQPQGTPEEFNRTVELAFGDHPWPASRGELIEYANQQGTFAKSDLARLKQIPHREYHSIKDLMNATREAQMAMAEPGPVTTAEHNRRAMGETPIAESPETVRTHSTDRFDEPIH